MCVTKRKVESLLVYVNGTYEESFKTRYFSYDYVLKTNYIAYPIEITKKEKQKENIYVEIKKLLSPYKASTIYNYETNVTNVDIVRTGTAIFKFKRGSNNSDYNFECFFKKNKDDSPLMLLCKIEYKSDRFKLNEIK